MDKKIAGLLGAVAGLATLSTAQAAPSSVPDPSQALQVSSYADLLAPIPNAAALVKADDALRAQEPPAAPPKVELVDHHHHHHHHHGYYGFYGPGYYYPPYYRYHHHHHHHHAYFGIPGIGGVVIGR